MLKVKAWKKENDLEFTLGKNRGVTLVRKSDGEIFIMGFRYQAHGYISGTSFIIEACSDKLKGTVFYHLESNDGPHFGHGGCSIEDLIKCTPTSIKVK